MSAKQVTLKPLAFAVLTLANQGQQEKADAIHKDFSRHSNIHKSSFLSISANSIVNLHCCEVEPCVHIEQKISVSAALHKTFFTTK